MNIFSHRFPVPSHDGVRAGGVMEVWGGGLVVEMVVVVVKLFTSFSHPQQLLVQTGF